MGVVYRAFDTLIGRDVALKTILLREIEDPNERQFLKERLFREAKSAGILSHPNIVTVYQIGEQDGITYIAMEYVDGPNLAELLSRPEKPSLETLVSILDQSAAALDYAHSRGVVHRDIKPGNIIVRSDGVAKIADFGVAKISSQNVTRTGMTLGTPHYMSPEQFHGRTIDGRSDQYSLAVMVYEIFTGKKPFTAESITGLMYKILHEEPNPRRDNPELSEAADAILRRALAKEPDGRYPSCSEFILQLRGVSGIALKQLPFESHMRTPSTGTIAQGGAAHPVPGHSVKTPAGAPATPSSGVPSSGILPPPVPTPQTWGFRSPEAGAPLEDTPRPAAPPISPASSAPSASMSAPPLEPASDGSKLPPPPAPPPSATPPAAGKPDSALSGKKASSPAASKPGAAKSAAAKTAGATPKTGSKMPLVVVAGVVLLLLILGTVGGWLYLQSQHSESNVETASTPSQDVPPQPDSAANTPVPEPVSPEPGGSAEVPAETSGTESPAATPSGQHAAPVIAAFVAEPASITAGQATTLRWNTSETTLVSIEPGLARGRSIGQVTVSPTETTRYRLVARGLGGRKTQDVTVTVKPAEESARQGGGSVNPEGMSLDALTRALAAGENIVSMNQLMVRVGLKGVSFPVNAQAQAAILAAGDRGERPKDAVVRLIDLAKQGGRH
ncbi:MAG: serine/threonine protein kinase [Bryobacterales bacterium]|nr:serine/threonine protein kinase [Bryobacterales bacterium]